MTHRGNLFCCAALLAALSLTVLARPQAKPRANHAKPVTVTLVRWPYT